MKPASNDLSTVSAAMPTPTTVEVLLAPWRYLFRPGKAAACMVAARPGAFWLHFALGNLLLAMTVFGVSLWADTRVAQPTMITVPHAENAQLSYRFQVRGLAETWQDWTSSGWLEEMITGLVFLPLFVVLCAALLAWFQLPVVHRGDSVVISFQATFRVVGSAGSCLIVLTFLVDSIAVHAVQNHRLWFATNAGEYWLYYAVAAIASGLASIWLLISWVAVGVRSAILRTEDNDSTIYCEGCGYNVTYQRNDDLCPECGKAVEESADRNRQRRHSGWRKGFGGDRWVFESFGIVLRGSSHYALLKCRKPMQRRAPFALFHFLTMGTCAAIWIAGTVSLVWETEPGDEMKTAITALALILAFLVPLAGWLTHRLVAAVVSTWWFVRDMLPRPQVAYVVLVYETAFLWVFCLYNSALLTSFFLYEKWMTQLLGRQFWNNLFNAPTEPLAVLGGNAALILWWMRRYHRCLMAVRWANH